MSWEALGSIAEIVGAVAVVISLLYVAFEIRSNTNTLKANTSKDASRSWSEFNLWMAAHPERMVFARAFSPDETIENFDASERQLLWLALRAFAQKVESEFYEYQAGLLHPDVWQAVSSCDRPAHGSDPHPPRDLPAALRAPFTA